MAAFSTSGWMVNRKRLCNSLPSLFVTYLRVQVLHVISNPIQLGKCGAVDLAGEHLIQALWTTAHHNLPLTVVLVNNGGYRIIKQRFLAFHGDDHFVGMDFRDPPVGFTALATALGLEATRVQYGNELPSVLSSAVKRPGPKLIEVIADGSVG